MNLLANFFDGKKILLPQNFNFAYDVVDLYAEKEPEQIALIWCNDKDEERKFTFKEISEKSKQAAAYLQSKGIQRGDKILLSLRRRYEYWIFVLALHRLGAVAIPCPSGLLKKDLIYRLQAVQPKVMIAFATQHFMKEIQEALASFPQVELVKISGQKEDYQAFSAEDLDLEKIKAQNQGRLPGGKDPMLAFFTSGTSSQPKLIHHDYNYPLAHIITAKCWLNNREGGIHFSLAESGWGKFSWGKIYGQWICGSAVFAYDMEHITPVNLIKKVEKYKITSFCATPTIYRYLLNLDLKKYNLSSFEWACTAGEYLGSDLYNSFYEKTGIQIHEAFGQTETTLLVGNFAGNPVKAASIGKASPIYDLIILDQKNQPCPVEKTGELCVKVNKDTLGISREGHRTEEFIYHTGDLVYCDKDDYIWFVSRKDDIIKSSGYRISPFEVEAVLQKHPAVKECAVTGEFDEKRGQIAKASVVLEDNYQACHEIELELFNFMRKETALYKVPRKIVFVDSLPRTSNGKIQRAKLR
ncbi:MAG: AMP-binding protein [Treponema sp.]|nr:AMP-binding protein [Treponema sp.]